jgi:hypothetical protein
MSLMQVLPSQIQASDLVDGYSFNTELKTDGIAQSVAVTGNGATATFVGAKASAGSISGPIIVACNVRPPTIHRLLMLPGFKSSSLAEIRPERISNSKSSFPQETYTGVSISGREINPRKAPA